MQQQNMARDPRPHVVIVGGGFGGTHAAHALHHAPVRVTVIVDSHNVVPTQVASPRIPFERGT